ERPLVGGGEAVELQRVLAHDRVDLDRHLAVVGGTCAETLDRRRRVDEVADPVHLDDEAAAGAPGDAAAKPRDHEAILRASGGAVAWQIATASASAAWLGAGTSGR